MVVPVLVLVLLAGCGHIDFDPIGGDCDSSLTITPSSATPNINSHVAFAASGGRAPYTYAVTGPGVVDANGRYMSPPRAGSATVTARDADGCTASATVDIGGTQMWFIGGATGGGAGVPTSQIWRTDDGVAWTLVGALPAARRSAGVAVFDDKIWLINGTATGDYNDVLVSSDGLTWTAAATFPAGNTYPSVIVYRGRLWVIGGYGLPGEVRVTDDGTTWEHVGDLGAPLHGGSVIVDDDRLWYLGGHDGATDTYYSETRWTTDGVSWTTAGTLPDKRELMQPWLADGSMWIAGGLGNGGISLGEIMRGDDGASWTQVASWPAPRYYTGLADFAGRLWTAGGVDGGGVWSSADGLTWRVEAADLPLPRVDGALVAFSPN